MAHENDLWFGNVQHAQWIKYLGMGFTRSRGGYSEEVEFEDSGIWVERSPAWRWEYALNFFTEIDDAAGVEAFGRFASGEFGTGFMYLVDPVYSRLNLFNSSWAAPGLIGAGWKNHGGSPPTFSATGANTFGKPPRKATWTVTTAPNEVFGRAFTFLIPPGHTLHLGGSGAVTGDGAVAVLPVGGVAAPIVLTADDAAPAFSNTVSGDVASSATVYMTRTADTVSTVTQTCMWAQVLPDGEVPMISRHIAGQGTVGLQFRGQLSQEPLMPMSGFPVLAVSGRLVEVEAWV